MSPRWGFKIFFYPMFYKHAAPLGLNAAMHQNSRWDIHRRGGVPRPTGWVTQPLRIQPRFATFLFSRIPVGHVAPLGLWDIWCMPRAINMSPRWGFKIFFYPMFYKHAAPLGLNDPLPRFLASSFSPPRPLCLCGVFITFHASRFNQNNSYFNNRHSIGPLYNVNRFAVRSPIDFANFRLPVNRYAV